MAILQKQGLTYNPSAPPPAPAPPPPPPAGLPSGLPAGPWIPVTKPQEPNLSQATGPAKILPPAALPPPAHKAAPVQGVFDESDQQQGPGQQGGGASPPMQLTMPQPNFVAAHSQSLISPENRAALDRANEEQKNATELGLHGDLAANEGQVKAFEDIHSGMTHAQDAMHTREQRRQDAFSNLRDKYEGLRKEVEQTGEPNYEANFGSKSAGDQALGVLSIMLGSLGSIHNGHNAGLELIDDTIKRNIQQQRDALAKKRGDVEEARNSLGEMRQQFGDERVADAAEYGRQLEAFKVAGDAEVARTKSPALIAKWAIQRAAINSEQAKYNFTVEKWVPGGIAGGIDPETEYRKYAKGMLDKGDMNIVPKDQWIATVYGGAGGAAATPKAGANGKLSPRLVNRMADLKAAADAVKKLGALMRKGSSISPKDREDAATYSGIIRRAGYQDFPERPLEVTRLSGPVESRLGILGPEIGHKIDALNSGGGPEEPEGPQLPEGSKVYE
ncbi:MAG TPA: hypothetical protein VKU44_00805 [Terriglobia bacterium]|nr:hypothetical protein [Terriglobia bacterium]